MTANTPSVSFLQPWREDCAAMGLGGANPLVIACYVIFRPECLTVLLHRVSAWLFVRGRVGWMLAKICWRLNVLLSSCHIDPLARIGGGLMLPHPTGVVIGNARIGRNVKIHQHVSLGVRDPSAPFVPQNFPTIGDNVVISAGAVILGGITIGDGALIGANAVVLEDVPPCATAVGIPARMLPHKPTP